MEQIDELLADLLKDSKLRESLKGEPKSVGKGGATLDAGGVPEQEQRNPSDLNQDTERCVLCIKNDPETASLHNHDGQSYCSVHYGVVTGALCAHCNEPITEECISALGRAWHPDHFVCRQCGLEFPDGVFVEHEGEAYCEDDFNSIFASKCFGCGGALLDESLDAGGMLFHPSCFKCKDCENPLTDEFVESDGEFLCQYDHHKRRGTLCTQCNEPLLEAYVTALGGRHFHKEHFKCNRCAKNLVTTNHLEKGGKYYCRPCHVQLFE